jgi:glycine/D-amino acid oxidase-like deaminating enzyme
VAAAERRTDAVARPYRQLSFWFDSMAEAGADDFLPRPALPGDLAADVAIVGGGLTGLWTAYYLAIADPNLRIVVLEKEIAGFGASGRNGGWCSALFPATTAALARRHGRDAALGMRRAMIETVHEVRRATESLGIECDYRRGGTVSIARGSAQLAAAKAEFREAKTWGVDEIELWGADRVPRGAAGALGATFDPACARVHPGKLVRGLARAVEGLGVRILEGTEVESWRPRAVTTNRGVVTAETIVIAVEGYAAAIPETHRRVLPLYSLMIATEPLSEDTWREIGISHGETFTDFRHLLIYGQRTADNRFAFGGRGARYHWGSSIRPDYDRIPAVFAHLERTLGELFPASRTASVTHRWGGPLGVPRDWHASASFDPATGIALAGGYVGDGLSTTNLAGRTLTDLILRRDTELTALPWVNHRSRRWEPEPLRFLGANAGLAGMGFADVEERLTGRPSVTARLLGPFTGH